MRAGSMDRVLEVWRDVETGRDPEYNSPIIEHAKVLTLWAGRSPVAEGETTDATEQRFAFAEVKFWTHWFADLRATDELRCEGQTFDVLGWREVGRREGLEIRAKVRG